MGVPPFFQRRHAAVTALLAAGILAAAPLSGFAAEPSVLGPGKVYRTINSDAYEVLIQKNGRTDVCLLDHTPVLDNLYPMILFADEEEPRALSVDGRYTMRVEVDDALGEGQGVLFGKKGCEWRLCAYPTQPFLTAQVVYTNTGKSPVRVARLFPAALGGTRRGGAHVGPGAAQAAILENGRLFQTFNDYAHVVTGKSQSQWNLAVHNPVSGRVLVAGFLTNLRGYTQVHLQRTENAPDDAFDLMRAACVYDPPIVVAPGERLASELFYIAVAENDPFLALERFAAASAAANGARALPAALPHGWDPWSTGLGSDISEELLLQDLDALDARLKRYGWNHFAIDAGWQRMKGDWEPNEKFPHGMKWMADEIHRRGMTAAIWIDPFTVNVKAPLAAEHPEWLADPNPLGKFLLGDDERILDVTAPGAYACVRDLFQKIGNDWGYDAIVEADFVYHLLLAERYRDASKTNVEVLRLGMQAIREGFGPAKFIMAVTPQPINAMYAQGVRVGHDCAPLWRSGDLQGNWGCVETLTNAVRRYYVAPSLYAPDQDCAFFGHDSTRARWRAADKPRLTREQSIAWLTGAALTGGVVKIGDRFSELTGDETAILSRLLPVPPKPARPIDLFQEAPPRIWALPVDCVIGTWLVVAVFNWDDTAPQTVSLDFRALGLDPNTYYAVFSFWQQQYHGTARGNLDVQSPPACVRVYGFRPYEDRPLFLATDRHFTMGATDFTELRWDPVARTLSGTFNGVADTRYTLHFLVPEEYRLHEATVSGTAAAASLKDRVLAVTFDCVAAAPETVTLQF